MGGGGRQSYFSHKEGVERGGKKKHRETEEKTIRCKGKYRGGRRDRGKGNGGRYGAKKKKMC